MSLHLPYLVDSVLNLRQSVATQLCDADQLKLDYLLDLTVLKVIANRIETTQRSQALQILRANSAQLAIWLDQTYPTLRLAMIEALTRVLLSLTVE